MNDTTSQRGASLLAAIFLIVAVAFLGTIAVSLTSTQSFTAVNEVRSAQGLFAAEGGLESAVYRARNGTLCTTINDPDTPLGNGSFKAIGTITGPAPPTTLSGALAVGDTVILVPAGTTVNYNSYGRLLIDSELMDYTGTAADRFTGVTRGVAGTAAATHLGPPSAATVYQGQCVIRSTGIDTAATPGNAARQVQVRTNARLSAYGTGDVQAVGNGVDTNLISMATSLPAGTNLIVAIVSLRNTNASTDPYDITANNLAIRRGGVALASNQNGIRVGGTQAPYGNPSSRNFYNETQFLLFREVNAPANPTYDVTAQAVNANITGEVKMVVMNSPPYSDFLDVGNVLLGSNVAAPTIILDRTTPLPAALAGIPNVVIAAVQLDNTDNGTQNVGVGRLVLSRVGGPVLASNTYIINLARTNRANRGTGVLLLANDAGAPANARYRVTGVASNANLINGEAKLLVLNGVPSAFLSGSAVGTLGIGDTTVRTLPTAFAAGENVVIAGAQYENSAAGAGTPRTIAASFEQIVTGGLSQSSNSFNLDFCSGTAECNDLTTGLVWAEPSALANASYEFHGRASVANSIRPEVKLLAIHLGLVPAAWSIDRQELFP